MPEVRAVKSDFWFLPDGKVGWEVRWDTLGNAGEPDAAGVADTPSEAHAAVEAAVDAWAASLGYDQHEDVRLMRVKYDDPEPKEAP